MVALDAEADAAMIRLRGLLDKRAALLRQLAATGVTALLFTDALLRPRNATMAANAHGLTRFLDSLFRRACVQRWSRATRHWPAAC